MKNKNQLMCFDISGHFYQHYIKHYILGYIVNIDANFVEIELYNETDSLGCPVKQLFSKSVIKNKFPIKTLKYNYVLELEKTINQLFENIANMTDEEIVEQFKEYNTDIENKSSFAREVIFKAIKLFRD